MMCIFAHPIPQLSPLQPICAIVYTCEAIASLYKTRHTLYRKLDSRYVHLTINVAILRSGMADIAAVLKYQYAEIFIVPQYVG